MAVPPDKFSTPNSKTYKLNQLKFTLLRRFLMAEDQNFADFFTIDELIAQAPALMAFQISPQFQNLTIKEIVFAMDVQASANRQLRPPRQIYWKQVKHELYLYFCTDDKKYQSIRIQFAAEGTKLKTAFVGMLSGVIGAQLGTAAGLISPLVALVLIAMSQIGKNAFCSSYDIDSMKPFADL